MYKDVEKVEVMWSDWKIYKRTPCEVYTRVMWYIRPFSWYNEGKKSEFASRAYFSEDKINNSSFIRRRGNKGALEN